MNKSSFYRLVFTCLFAIVAAGCDSKPGQISVSGEVVFDGEPIEKGDIIFTPSDPDTVPSAGKIVDGKFEMNATSGENKVSIYSTRSTGEVDPTMGMAPQEQFIPAKYNEQSELSAAVSESNHVFAFELTP